MKYLMAVIILLSVSGCSGGKPEGVFIAKDQIERVNYELDKCGSNYLPNYYRLK